MPADDKVLRNSFAFFLDPTRCTVLFTASTYVRGVEVIA